MSTVSLSNLQQLSNQADIDNGLPVGTTYAIAGTESSYGTNLGTIGNIFQVTPATQQSYGVDGNDPNSVANYISTQFYNNPNSAGYQNIATSYQLYQNGPSSSLSTPAQYSATSPFAQFLAGLGSNTSTTQASDTNTSAAPLTTGSTGSAPSWLTGILDPSTAGSATNPTSSTNAASSDTMNATPGSTGGLSSVLSWFPGWLRLSGGALAFVLIAIGVLALVFLSKNRSAT